MDKLKKRKYLKVMAISFIAVFLLYGFVYTSYGYAGHVQGVENVSKAYCYATRSIIFNATAIGSSSASTISLQTREPLTPDGSVSQSAEIDRGFEEYGLNEKLQQVVFGSYNQFLPQAGEGYSISLSENFSTYVMDQYGNGTNNWWNVTNNVAPFANLYGSGTYYSAVLSSPRAMMNEWCAQNGYTSPVLLNNSVSIQTHRYPNNILTGREVSFIGIGESEPINLSTIGTIRPTIVWTTGKLILLAVLLIFATLEAISLLSGQGEFFTALVRTSVQAGQSNVEFPNNYSFQFNLDPTIQDILNNSYQQYLLGNISYSDFMGIWGAATNASIPDTLQLGYTYADNSANKGIDVFTTITAFIQNIINIVMLIIMIAIIVVVVSLVIKYTRRLEV